jgi:hypothetical protein
MGGAKSGTADFRVPGTNATDRLRALRPRMFPPPPLYAMVGLVWTSSFDGLRTNGRGAHTPRVWPLKRSCEGGW